MTQVVIRKDDTDNFIGVKMFFQLNITRNSLTADDAENGDFLTNPVTTNVSASTSNPAQIFRLRKP
jgi:hypothetical protein